MTKLEELKRLQDTCVQTIFTKDRIAAVSALQELLWNHIPDFIRLIEAARNAAGALEDLEMPHPNLVKALKPFEARND